MLFNLVMLTVVFASSRALCSMTKNSNNMKTSSRFLSMRGGNLPSLKDDMKPFYALGVNIAKQVGGELKTMLSAEEIEAMVVGFSDSMLSKINGEDERNILLEHGKALNEVITGRASKVLDAEKKKGDDFVVKYLLSNPRAVRTASGLIFNEIIAGVGAQPTAASTVNVHYHGTLVDGTVFDSSVDRGEPIKFPLKNVIPGWQEGVSMMRVGGKATLVVPSNLAYGENGSPPVIPGGATLIFEVELLSVA